MTLQKKSAPLAARAKPQPICASIRQSFSALDDTVLLTVFEAAEISRVTAQTFKKWRLSGHQAKAPRRSTCTAAYAIASKPYANGSTASPAPPDPPAMITETECGTSGPNASHPDWRSIAPGGLNGRYRSSEPEGEREIVGTADGRQVPHSHQPEYPREDRGIDAPEIRHPGYTHDDDFGPESRDEMRRIVGGASSVANSMASEPRAAGRRLFLARRH